MARVETFERVADSLDRWLAELGLARDPHRWSGDALLGLRRREPSVDPALSAGGRCRLVSCADGWVAIHLARSIDVESVPAVIGAELSSDDRPAGDGDKDDTHIHDRDDLDRTWQALARWAEIRCSSEVAARCHLLDIPASEVGETPAPLGANSAPDDDHVEADGLAPTWHDLRVIDTTVLWAGPLAARLLGDLGATIVANPSPHRSDPTQVNDPAFFALLHQHHQPSGLDPATSEGRSLLEHELTNASVVLLSARPRALRPLDLDPEDLLARHPHLMVVTITAFGFYGARCQEPGLGDDVAAAAGAVDRQPHPAFVGDALADPVTGTYAALAMARVLRSDGGGQHLDISMLDATRAALAGA